MNPIESFLKGKLDLTDFWEQYRTDEELYRQVQALIPAEAVNNEDHEFWNNRTALRDVLSCYDYDIRDMLYSHYGDAETDEDRLGFFYTILSLYFYDRPAFRCTTKYEDSVFFRSDIAGEVYGGRDVEHLIDEIAAGSAGIRSKSERKKKAKRQLEELFHTAGGKKPRWIQGPAWPMGKQSPMRFVSQKRFSDGVDYVFEDVDTEEQSVVREYY